MLPRLPVQSQAIKARRRGKRHTRGMMERRKKKDCIEDGIDRKGTYIDIVSIDVVGIGVGQERVHFDMMAVICVIKTKRVSC